MLQIRATILPRSLIILKKKRHAKLCQRETSCESMRGLPVETSALTDERTTYISQETVPTATSYMTASKSDIKRQKAHRDRRVED